MIGHNRLEQLKVLIISLEDGEFEVKGSPRHPQQKYYLVELGKALQRNLKEEQLSHFVQGRGIGKLSFCDLLATQNECERK